MKQAEKEKSEAMEAIERAKKERAEANEAKSVALREKVAFTWWLHLVMGALTRLLCAPG